jgi:hypothetical protein
VNARLFWTSLGVQAALLAIPFVALALALDRSFFEDWGWAVGPAVWLACSLGTARILGMPFGYVVFSAVAGGVAGGIVMLATTHWAGMAAALLVFAASCGSYDPDAEAEAQREWAAERAARKRAKKRTAAK